MSSSSSSSSASSSVAASSSSTPPNFLSLLPSALIPVVCVYLTPSEKSSLWSRLCRSHRSQLTSQCFQQDHLHLTPAVLDSLISSPYLAKLLSHCLSLTVRLSYNDVQPPDFAAHLIQFFNPLPPQPMPDPATNPTPASPAFPFPHLTHLSLHEDSDTGVIPAILSHPSFPRTLHQLHVLYRSYQHPLPPFLTSTFPMLVELSLPSTLTTTNVRAILRLPALRVLDMCQASVVNGQGLDEDDMEGGWVNAMRAAGGVGQQLEVLLMPRGGGQIDDILKLMHSQVKLEPVEEAETEEKKEEGKDNKEGNDDSEKTVVEEKKSELELIHSSVEGTSGKLDEKAKHNEEEQEDEKKAASAAEERTADGEKPSASSPGAADAETKADEEVKATEEIATQANDEPIPDAPPLLPNVLFLPAPPPPPPAPVGRYPELEEKQKAEEALAQALKRACTPPPTATGRRKKPIPVPSNIRYLSISGQLSLAGVHSLTKLPKLHSLLFDFYQMASTGEVFEAFVDCAKDMFTQLRVLRLCDWSDEQVAGNRRQRRETKLLVTERIKLMLSRFHQLEYLDIRFPPLCDVPACMPALYEMSNLRKLWLIDTQSVRALGYDDDEQMEGQWRDEWTVGATPAFPHLVELNLSSLAVDEESVLTIVANAPKLLDVSMLYSPQLTLASLFALSRHCPELRFLDVDGCSNTALTQEAWELGHDKYAYWLSKQHNLVNAPDSQSNSLFSLSSSSPSLSSSTSSPSSSPSLPFVSPTLTFPSLQFLYLTLAYDTDTDFVNLDTGGLTRFVEALSSSPLTHANVSSEHLSSTHVALFEQWSQLCSLSIATTGFGSQPRMAKTMLEYDGKAQDVDGQQQDNQDDDDNSDEDEDEDDEDDDEKENDGEETKEEKSAGTVSDSSGKEEKADIEEKAGVAVQKKQKTKKNRKDKPTADSSTRTTKIAADDVAEKKEEKKDASEASTASALQTHLSSTASSSSSSSSILSPSNPQFAEPDVDNLYIYTRVAKRTPLEQSAHDRSITTYTHLHTTPRTQLDLHMLRYEGTESDETTALVFSRTFRDEEIHDGMAGREAYFADLRGHLGRDRKRGESELWSAIRGRGRGRRRRRMRGGRGGFGFGGR